MKTKPREHRGAGRKPGEPKTSLFMRMTATELMRLDAVANGLGLSRTSTILFLIKRAFDAAEQPK